MVMMTREREAAARPSGSAAGTEARSGRPPYTLHAFTLGAEYAWLAAAVGSIFPQYIDSGRPSVRGSHVA